MGFTPREIDRMSLWEFQAVSYAFARSKGVEDQPSPPTDEEFFERTGQSG